MAEFVTVNARKLNDAVDYDRGDLFEFFGLRTVYDRYLLRHPENRDVIETPQYFFLRVACGLQPVARGGHPLLPADLGARVPPVQPHAVQLGHHPPADVVAATCSTRPRTTSRASTTATPTWPSSPSSPAASAWPTTASAARGSLIRGTNGLSNGIVPWLKTLDSSVAAVNQGGRRKGAACVYLETWHADIEEFLELRDNTGDDARRTHNLNLANWVPDLFMERVEKDWQWSLFDPKQVPHLCDLYGEEFERAYVEAEEQGLFERQIPARELYSRMMRTLAQTGNGWMTFKDASNLKCNQTAEPGNTVHLSNLCTEILEVTSQGETAVCNLGSVNLGRLVRGRPASTSSASVEVVRTAVPFLDRVIDINYYPTDEAATSNERWRPVGLGMMGLQDVFFQLRPALRQPRGPRPVPARIAEEIYFHALWASTELAEAVGPAPGLRPDPRRQGPAAVRPVGRRAGRPGPLGARCVSGSPQHGLRNSLLIAIAPTATIASIAGCYECIEPQVSNLFKRETLSGEFLQINRYLVRELQARGPVERGHAPTRSSGPRARSRTSTRSPTTCGRSTAPPGSCPCAR